MASSYCEAIVDGIKDAPELHKAYHDTEYGFALTDDNELFGRLVLELNQAGLSWSTILKKKDALKQAYEGFDVKKVAQYGEKDIARLLDNPGIIRNKLKINAAIYNAQQIVRLQDEFGSFKNWLDINYPKTKDEWVKLFKKTFKFTGGEITNEFLVSTGYLPGAHIPSCPIYKVALMSGPKWAEGGV